MADSNYSTAGSSEIALKVAKDKQKRHEASLVAEVESVWGSHWIPFTTKALYKGDDTF